MATGLPPWLAVNPNSGVPLFLHGFSEGQHAAAANLQRDQQNQLAAQHAAEVAQETEVQKQRVSATLASDLIDRQVKAQTAARQLAGMQKYQSLVGSGADPTQALIQSAPDMFFQHPEAMTTAMHQNEAAKASAKNSKALDEYRQKQLAMNERRQNFREDQAKIAPDKSIQHVGNKVVRVNPDGTVTELFDASGIDPLDRAEASAAYKTLYNPYALDEERTNAQKAIDRIRSGKTVRMRAPDGTEANVPINKVDAAKAKKAIIVE